MIEVREIASLKVGHKCGAAYAKC